MPFHENIPKHLGEMSRPPLVVQRSTSVPSAEVAVSPSARRRPWRRSLSICLSTVNNTSETVIHKTQHKCLFLHIRTQGHGHLLTDEHILLVKFYRTRPAKTSGLFLTRNFLGNRLRLRLVAHWQIKASRYKSSAILCGFITWPR